ncbi:AIR synthase-related protein, partial [Xanthomonas sacchari]
LALWQAGRLDVTAPAADPLHERLRQRLLRPTPRVQAGLRLRGLARACVDVSDGLLADLEHICARSGVGAELDLAALPAVAAPADADPAQVHAWQLGGGDDYELCFTADPAQRAAIAQALQAVGVTATPIGRIVARRGIVVRGADGQPWQPPRSGYQHFLS